MYLFSDGIYLCKLSKFKPTWCTDLDTTIYKHYLDMDHIVSIEKATLVDIPNDFRKKNMCFLKLKLNANQNNNSNSSVRIGNVWYIGKFYNLGWIRTEVRFGINIT